MISGTTANRRRVERQKAENIRRLKAISARHKALNANREEVIAEVCALFGWKKLDPFAEKMIDRAFAGKMVDIKQLKADIAVWKKAQETPADGTEDKPNGDIQIPEA